MKALKTLGLLLIFMGLIIITAESETLPILTLILGKASGIAALFLGYKALTKADPSLNEDNETI